VEPLALLSGFGKLAYTNTAQGGKLTVGFGSKAGVGPASFESGLQLTLTQHYGGTNVDLAWRTGPSAGSKSDVVDITSPSRSPRSRPCRASRRSSPRTPQGPAGAGPCEGRGWSGEVG
jgi:hypothetical protein